MNIIKHLLLLSFSVLSFAIFAQDIEKDIINEWKMIKTEIDGEPASPVHEKLILELSKKNTFTITAEYEETHTGTWEFNQDKSKIILTDDIRDYKQELNILDYDDAHLALGNFDGKNMNIYFIPLGKKKHQDLTHVEHSVAKRWTCYKSTEDKNVGLMIEFKADKTFILIPDGFKVPVATGTWEITDDNKHVQVQKREGGVLDLEIIERHKHELVLKSTESDAINYLHDPKMTRLDIQEGIFSDKGKPLHSELKKDH